MPWLDNAISSTGDAVYEGSISARSVLRRVSLRLSLVLVMAGHRFKRQRGFGRATELAFSTLFALVPVTYLALMILTSFASSNEGLERFLFQYLLPTSGSSVVEYIRDFATKVGTVSVVSSLLLVVMAVSLLANIEGAINDIWEVRDRRRFLVKLAAYWTLLTLGPILLFCSLYLTSQLRLGGFLPAVYGDGAIYRFVSHGLSLLAIWIVCYLVYTWLPNIRVAPSAGLVGAIIAGSLWQGGKFIFNWYVVNVVAYERIYGSLSVLPLSLLWLFLTWIIILWGSQIAFVWQHLPVLKNPESAESLTGWNRVDAALRILVCIARRFQAGAGRVSIETVTMETQAETQQMQEIASHLIEAHMIHRLEEQDGGYTLARPPETIALSDVVALFDGIEISSADLTDEVGVYTATLGGTIRQIISGCLAGKTVQTLLDDIPHPAQKRDPVNTLTRPQSP